MIRGADGPAASKPDGRALRVLFFSDTHLGFDMPLRPRVEKRRRGPDFYRNFELALEAAIRERVDLVVHGGDLFHRSRVRDELVLRALDLVRPVTEAGIPVVIVPGNHERSVIPLRLLWTMPNLYVFDQPGSVHLNIRGLRVALAGFPFHRRDIRASFSQIVDQTEAWRENADIRLLCMHHAVEGAQVGPADFTFRSGRDIIPGRAIPPGFAAVLSGHIHRAQILRRDLAGRALAAPVFYPGSTERTAFAERDERKGYLLLDVLPGGHGGSVLAHEFRELPARPMEILELQTGGLGIAEMRSQVRRRVARLHPESVLRVRFLNGAGPTTTPPLTAPALRALAPKTMTIEIDRPRPGNQPSPS